MPLKPQSCRSVSVLLFLFLSVALLGSESAHSSKASKDNFVLNYDRPLDSINVFSQGGYVMWDLTNHIFDFLARENPKTGELEPHLAESWTIAKDKKSAVFKIRKGVTFHDGKPLTAEDVAFSWDVHNNLEYKSVWYSPNRKEVKPEVIDSHTIRFEFDYPSFPKFSQVLRWMVILPKHYYGDLKKKKIWNTKNLGSGPYKLLKFKRGKRVELVRNDAWWGFKVEKYKGMHSFPRVTHRYITEPLLMVKALERGELDLIRFFEPIEFEKVARGPKWGKTALRVKTDVGRKNGRREMVLNHRNPIFKDKRTRKAMIYLFNREVVAEKLYFGAMIPGIGPWHQKNSHADPKLKPLPYDPKKALSLLREAGWKDSNKDGVLDQVIDGKRVDFRFTILNYKKDREKMLTMFREAMKVMGIDAKVKTIEAQTCFKLVDELKFDAYYWQGAWSSTVPHIYGSYHSKYADDKRPSNITGYKNPKLDKLLDESVSAFDPAIRKKLYGKIYRILVDDAVVIPVFDDKYVMYGVSSRVNRPQDVLPHSFGKEYWSFKD